MWIFLDEYLFSGLGPELRQGLQGLVSAKFMSYKFESSTKLKNWGFSTDIEFSKEAVCPNKPQAPSPNEMLMEQCLSYLSYQALPLSNQGLALATLSIDQTPDGINSRMKFLSSDHYNKFTLKSPVNMIRGRLRLSRDEMSTDNWHRPAAHQRRWPAGRADGLAGRQAGWVGGLGFCWFACGVAT